MLLNLYCKALGRTGHLTLTHKETYYYQNIIDNRRRQGCNTDTADYSVYQWTFTGHSTPGQPGEQWQLVIYKSSFKIMAI